MSWKTDGLCAQTDPALFFLEIGQSGHDAKRICAQCPVLDQCREYALVRDERFGIWGGLSPRQRTKERERRGLPRMCQVCHGLPARGEKAHTCAECAVLLVRPRAVVKAA